jgi:hypothetical protein
MPGIFKDLFNHPNVELSYRQLLLRVLAEPDLQVLDVPR